MSRLTRRRTGAWRWPALAAVLALGACTTVVEGGHHRGYHPHGPGFGRPVVVVPAPRAYYYDGYRDRHRHHHHHHRHHRRDRW